MRVGSTFNVAFRALRRNKLRSVLTALGIIIGVGAVIAMVGIGNGAKAQVEAQIASLGENVILIFSGSTTSSGIRSEEHTSELQSQSNLVCRLLLEKKKNKPNDKNSVSSSIL